MDHTPHLKTSPWARDALTVDEAVGFHARAAALGAYVSVTAGSPRGPWTVYATNASIRAGASNVSGSLPVAISAVLDDFRAQADVLAEEVEDLLGLDLALRYTNEELVQIASQSGIEVERA